MKIFIILFSLTFLLSFCKDKNSEKPVSVNLEEEKSKPSKQVEKEDTTEETTEVSNLPAKALTIGKHKVVAKNGLMLRTEANKESPAIVRMDKNTQAEILEYTNVEEVIEGNKARWAKVKFKKYTGYAFSHYLKPLDGAKTVDPSNVKPEEEE
ncbi:MAG: SH3 domain-containing protein [Leptospiraceae bacterium]|nr:SH3 domain-containing protein [Leptospiraceae bacterium]